MPPRNVEEHDTIIVQNENESPRSSRASSISEGSAGSDLPAGNDRDEATSQHLESPEPEELDDDSRAESPQSSRQASVPTDRPAYLNQIQAKDPFGATMEERLQMMPELRPLPWRDGVEPGSEIETGGDSRRKQIRFGCLLATRGNVVAHPCKSCENGRGKFNQCIALDGYFKGACASCQLSGRPNRCSIKVNDDGMCLKLQSPMVTSD